jgi:hypothetical protein
LERVELAADLLKLALRLFNLRLRACHGVSELLQLFTEAFVAG